MVTETAFIVGAQRAGSTYLRHILDQHPEIAMAQPAAPEPKFFLRSEEVERGPEHYFAKHFQPTAQTRLFIEKSTSYIESPEAARQIKQMFPDARIIISFRDPVFRAISNYFFSVRNGLEKRSIEAVFLDQEPAPEQFNSSVSPFHYLERGQYARYLKSYLEIFDRERIKVIVFTRFVGNLPEITKLFRWLGVDDTFEPTGPAERINSSDNTANVADAVLDYLHHYYRPYVAELEELLQLELPEWKQL